MKQKEVSDMLEDYKQMLTVPYAAYEYEINI